MAASISLALVALSRVVTVQEALSGIFGSISMATWAFLLVGPDVMRAGGEDADDTAGTSTYPELQDRKC